jgi:phosphoadenosine phosphosulfate reductase
MKNISTLTEEALIILREYEPTEGYYLAFSGGKDSIVCYDLLLKSGCKFDAHYSVTTIDPPELMRYMKEHYPNVFWHYPIYKNKPINFYNMIVARGLPTRLCRWCCELFKETGGVGRLMIDGVRKEESPKRALRNKFEYFLKPYWNKKYKGKILEDDIAESLVKDNRAKKIIHIIFEWTHKDIWDYIRQKNLEYCNLYDEGWDRIGCIFCPMSNIKSKIRDCQKYPIHMKNIIKSIEKFMAKGRFEYFENANEVFEWWISNDSVNKYLARKEQMLIRYDEEER